MKNSLKRLWLPLLLVLALLLGVAPAVAEDAPLLQVRLNETKWYSVDLTPYLMENNVWVEVPIEVSELFELGNQVAINSPETVKAIEYVTELSKTFIEGCAAWTGVSNNNAFIEGKISLTSNGISIYFAGRNSEDPNKKAVAEDMDHAPMPMGPVGTPTELHLLSQAMLFKHSKFPQAAKAYLQFMWEREQYEPWQAAALGYISHPLKAYDDNSVWRDNPITQPFQGCVARMRPHGHAGTLGPASAACLADWIVVDMFASVATGMRDAKSAAAEAERRAKRYYR